MKENPNAAGIINILLLGKTSDNESDSLDSDDSDVIVSEDGTKVDVSRIFIW